MRTCDVARPSLRHDDDRDASISDAAVEADEEQGGRADPPHQTKKGKQWYFGMKAHIGVDAGSGLSRTA